MLSGSFAKLGGREIMHQSNQSCYINNSAEVKFPTLCRKMPAFWENQQSQMPHTCQGWIGLVTWPIFVASILLFKFFYPISHAK